MIRWRDGLRLDRMGRAAFCVFVVEEMVVLNPPYLKIRYNFNLIGPK